MGFVGSGVILVPFLLAILWFGIWGGSAAYAEINGIIPLWDSVQSNPETGVYKLLGSMKGGWFISLVVLFNIIIFAVTTSDSASFFVAMQMSKGQQNPKISMRLLWGVIIGLTGIIFQLTADIDEYEFETDGSEVYGSTLDVLAGPERIEVASGAMGPHDLDLARGITGTWVGMGFGLERLLMISNGDSAIGPWTKSLSCIDGIRLTI